MRLLGWRIVALVLGLATVGAPARGEGPKEGDEQTADAVVAAHGAKDDSALRKLAEAPKPDPWRVVDVLSGRGEHGAAVAFAKLVRPELGKLAAYAESRRGKTDDARGREALVKASKAIAEKRLADVAPLVAGVDALPDCVVKVRLLLAGAIALDGLKLPAESRARLLAARGLAEKIGWREATALASFNAGMRSKDLRDTPGVFDGFEKASAVRLAMKDPQRAGDCWRMVTHHLLALGEQEQALEAMRKALAIFEAGGVKERIVLARSDIAVLHGNAGRHRDAVAEYERAAALADQAGDRKQAGSFRANAAEALCMAAEFERAITTADAVLALPAEDVSPQAKASALAALALANLGLGRIAESGKRSEEALALHRAAGDRFNESRLLMRLGNALREQGQERLALDYRRRARVLVEALGEPRNTAIAWMNEGNSLLSLGELAGALQAYERAVDLNAGLGETVILGELLINMANVLVSLGDATRAREQQRRAVDVLRRTGEEDALVAAMINLGDGLIQDGEYAEAETLLQQALAKAEGTGNALRVTQANGTLAAVAVERGDLKRALALAERALAGARATGNETERVGPLSEVARIRTKQGDLPGARAALEESLGITRRAGDRGREASVLENLCTLDLAAGRNEAALSVAEEVVALIAVLYAGLADSASASGRSERAEVYASGAEAARRLGRPADVLRFLELGRAAALVEGLRAREAIAAATVPPELAAQESEARAAEALASGRWRAAAGSKDAKGRAEAVAREADWKKSRAVLERVLERIQSAARGTADGAYPRPIAAQALSALLGADEALVLFQTSSAPAYGLVVERAGLRVVPLGDPEPIQKAAALLVKNDKGDLDAAAVRELERLLVKPLGFGAGVRRVLVSPDGALAYVPFTVLWPDRELVHVPSGTTLAVLSEGSAAPGSRVLAFADPDYGTRPQASGTLRGGQALVPLPAARLEAKAVGDVVHVGAEATETRFVKALAENARWRAVHVACHGWIDPARPLLSALALGASDADDGFLTALDVFRLRVPADLVVLSACETGKGRVYAAEGIVGLTRAFMFAGAPRVIVSLWKVDDQATRVLMEAFYERWKKGVPAPAALAAAQRAVREHEEEALDVQASRAAGRDVRTRRRVFEDPRYWAGWSLWGLQR